ncbi:kynureninase [Azospirillum sp.]|uniref:kynureninase n=1 Tax=Azospirillum sp. TaxID=34012 RepID=UPI002D339527|nr:kynureninase [Azospirillum sp.]HYD64915.1 kynureninase [Azospirillum sp.]
MTGISREDALALDAADELAAVRERFVLPEGEIYLDGNSLGALPRATAERLRHVVEAEWGRDLIRSWNAAGWIDLPQRVGDKIGRLVGAAAGEVVVADSTSVNLFKALSAALRLRPDRRVIVTERGNFPTDLYVAQGLIEQLGGRHELRMVERDAVAGAIGADTAVVMLTHVDYRTGAVHDMAGVTAAAHGQGALMLWDLAHSAGAMPVDLDGCGADLAVGCGYKYLNGGPGAPAFLYVARRHQEAFRQPLTGWMGHAEPFAFGTGYRPADGIRRALCGTPPVLSLAALEAGVDELLAVDLRAVRRKSLAMTGLFRRLVAGMGLELGLELAGPEDPAACGSQVSLRHPQGYAIVQALIARGIVGDFRAPDILRFGFAPLYLRFADVWDAAAALRDVLETGAWDRPEFHRRHAVT